MGRPNLIRRRAGQGMGKIERALKGADPQFESCRTLFEKSSAAYDALAGKFTRIAEGLGGGGTRR